MAGDAFFAPMPPLEGKKALSAITSTTFGEWKLGDVDDFCKSMLIDVKAAHLEITCDSDDVCVYRIGSP